jgi:hypothetical protein
MPTIAEHNRQAAAAYAAIPHEHWIEQLDDGRHVLVRPLTAEDREREYNFIKGLSPSRRTRAFWVKSTSPAKTSWIN